MKPAIEWARAVVAFWRTEEIAESGWDDEELAAAMERLIERIQRDAQHEDVA